MVAARRALGRRLERGHAGQLALARGEPVLDARGARHGGLAGDAAVQPLGDGRSHPRPHGVAQQRVAPDGAGGGVAQQRQVDELLERGGRPGAGGGVVRRPPAARRAAAASSAGVTAWSSRAATCRASSASPSRRGSARASARRPERSCVLLAAAGGDGEAAAGGGEPSGRPSTPRGSPARGRAARRRPAAAPRAGSAAAARTGPAGPAPRRRRCSSGCSCSERTDVVAQQLVDRRQLARAGQQDDDGHRAVERLGAVEHAARAARGPRSGRGATAAPVRVRRRRRVGDARAGRRPTSRPSSSHGGHGQAVASAAVRAAEHDDRRGPAAAAGVVEDVAQPVQLAAPADEGR